MTANSGCWNSGSVRHEEPAGANRAKFSGVQPSWREDLQINRDGYSRPCGVRYADWSLLMSRVSIPFREPALEGSQPLRP